jgi:hypothetical protein
MRENSRQPDKHLQDNPLGLHLRTFAASLLEYGYADETIHSKLWLLGDLERWLRRTKLAVTNLDERLLEAFLKHKHEFAGANPKRSGSFSIISESAALFRLGRWFATDRPWLTS